MHSPPISASLIMLLLVQAVGRERQVRAQCVGCRSGYLYGLKNIGIFS